MCQQQGEREGGREGERARERGLCTDAERAATSVSKTFLKKVDICFSFMFALDFFFLSFFFFPAS